MCYLTSKQLTCLTHVYNSLSFSIKNHNFLITTKSAVSCNLPPFFATLPDFAYFRLFPLCLLQNIFHYPHLLHANPYENHLFLPVFEWNIWFCCEKHRPASSLRKSHETRTKPKNQLIKLPPNHPQSIDNHHHIPHTTPNDGMLLLVINIVLCSNYT